MDYYSAIKKNTFESVLNEVDETGAYYTEQVSQKEKHQYSILIQLYGIWKDDNDDPICRSAKETDVKNRLLDSVEVGEGGMI